MGEKCIFCDICAGRAPSQLIHEDEQLVAFADIRPAARKHYLVVPREHLRDTAALSRQHLDLVDSMVALAGRVLGEGADLSKARLGFHVPPFNSVKHLHLHVIYPEDEMGYVGRLVFWKDSWWFKTPDLVREMISKL